MTTSHVIRKMARVVRAGALALGLAAAAILTAGGSVSALTIADIQKRGTLAVGLSDVSPPYATKNEKMEHVGLEVELAEMIAKTLGVKLRVVIVTAANRVACLLTDCADILIYGLTITPERATQVWFSQPYAINASGIIAAKGTAIASLEDLVGKRVGVIRAAFGDPVLTEQAPRGTTIQRFDDMSGLLQAMLAGHVDAIFENTLIPGVLNTMRRGSSFETKFVMSAGYWGIAMRQDRENLRQWINSYLFTIKTDGKLDALHRKHLNIPMPTLPTF